VLAVIFNSNNPKYKYVKTKSFFKVHYWRITAVFVLIKLFLHLLTYNHYELHRDEMLFFNQGSYLSFGNVSVPPFISWVAFLIKAIFGYSVFGIRLIPMVLGSLSVIIIAKLVRELGGKQIALILSCTAFVLSPGFLIFDSLFTVNVFDQFFWLVIAYLIIKMANGNNPKLWLWIGLVCGLAFLNKYLVVYLMAGYIIALLSTVQRKLIFNQYFVYALLIGLLIISPNIYWQFSHGWPIFRQIEEIKKTQMVNMKPSNFLIDFFNLNYVATFFWLSGLIGVFVIKDEKRYRYLGVATLVIVFLFMLTKGKAYYALGLIPVLFALSGYILEKYLTHKLNIINYFIFSILILFLSLAIPFSIPVFSFEKLSQYSEKTDGFVSYPFSRWEDGKIHHISQIFSDMTGWKEMVGLVKKAYLKIPEEERTNATIYAERNYGYAGAVHFYGKQYHLPEAITFLDSYVL
jgi:4-amino-4-deoxy-L-arabinose transferase-like glycosyltransferase